MKKIFKYFLGILATGILFSACETTELDIRDNPNFLKDNQGDVNLFINAIQLDYADFVNLMGFNAAQPVRLIAMQDRQYVNAFSPSNLDFEWELAYQNIIADIRKMQPLAEQSGSFRTLGIAQVIEADVLTTLVDFFGDVPYIEAIQAPENINPKLDPGADVYAKALELLDQAINNFNRTDNVLTPSIDFYYNKNWAKWVKLANTMKMKIYLQTRLVDADALNKFQAIVNSGNYISSTADDFQFQYGINVVQPDTRHPEFASNYTPTGAGDYMSNWLMNTMANTNDPRTRYYFYRQTNETPGQDGVAPNEETISCSLETPPQHYIDGGFTFCGLPNGYWGRDHGDSDGIPPDGFLRTAWGVYPVGGMFDDNRFEDVEETRGGKGAGIQPILLASWVDFMRAEVAMVNNNPAQAKGFVLEGISKSLDKVFPFANLDSEADSDFFATNGDVQDFADFIDSSFDDGSTTDKWNILAEQYFIANFGSGLGAYNFYRRTGFPTTLQPNREPNPGGFIRSFRYSANSANNNVNIQQRQNVTTQVFWDNNPSSPGFPIAN